MCVFSFHFPAGGTGEEAVAKRNVGATEIVELELQLLCKDSSETLFSAFKAMTVANGTISATDILVLFLSVCSSIVFLSHIYPPFLFSHSSHLSSRLFPSLFLDLSSFMRLFASPPVSSPSILSRFCPLPFSPPPLLILLSFLPCFHCSSIPCRGLSRTTETKRIPMQGNSYRPAFFSSSSF